MTVTIHKFLPEDWPLYRAIRLEALEREPQVYGTGLHQAQALTDAEWRQRLAAPDAGTFGALTDDQPIGMAGWFLPTVANQRHCAIVIGVYVRGGFRGQAIGRRLVAATVADAETQAEDVSLHVATENDPARRLYETLGFRVVATLPRALKYAGVYYDEHLMMRTQGQL